MIRLASAARRLCVREVAVVVTLWACDPNAERRAQAAASASALRQAYSAAVAAESARAKLHLERERERVAAPAKQAPKKEEPARAPESDEPVVEGHDDLSEHNSRLILDGLNDVGPAGPASAFARGVILISRADELVVSTLRDPPSTSPKPARGAFTPIDADADAFFPVARGPAIGARHVYWISRNRLVRRALGGSDLEILATDARPGTRVAVAGTPEAVAYISQGTGPEDEPLAKLRFADGKVVTLTPEGAGASSVALSAVGRHVIASSIDGRSGMTPLHARRAHLDTKVLEPDVVVWVAGAAQAQTEVSSVASGSFAWLLMPVERDVTHFGLVALGLGAEPKMDPPLRWRTYPNGLDRAPVAAAEVCGAPMAIYVRPADARPRTTQELVISTLSLAETAMSEPLATARGFSDVSLAPFPNGAVVAYVADRRTWARVVRCK